jgi:hypothetical protein
MAEWLETLLRISEVLLQISARKPALLTMSFRDIYQSLLVNAEIVF